MWTRRFREKELDWSCNPACVRTTRVGAYIVDTIWLSSRTLADDSNIRELAAAEGVSIEQFYYAKGDWETQVYNAAPFSDSILDWLPVQTVRYPSEAEALAGHEELLKKYLRLQEKQT